MFKDRKRAWIIAEIGVNHEGDEAVAADLVRKAAESGADAVKFQTYQPEGYVSRSQPERLKAVAGRALSYEAFERLAALAKSLGITFFSTPLAFDDVAFLDRVAPIFKVATGELTWLDLIRRIAETGKPMIVSTGLGLEHEIDAALKAIYEVRPDINDRGELLLMHCVSAYPTPAEQANLRNIFWLRDRFGVPVGYSDHTLGIKACELAIAAGAVALEKHFTYRKENQAFRDHALSVEPGEMKELIAAVRTAEIYLGQYGRQRGEAEMGNMTNARRSVAAARDIRAGSAITKDMLTGLRPLIGIPVENNGSVIGRSARRDILAGEVIAADDLA
jgi:N,N'-diacetyllegionaminate synthase